MPNEQPDRKRASASLEVITDAVIMAYIHEISARHRPNAPVGAGAGASHAAA
jgi:hypothetical protein